MPDQLPFGLFLGWAALFAFVCAQYHHEQMIKALRVSATSRLLKMVEVSSLLSLVAGVGILIYYFIQVRWYWVVVLAVLGSMTGALCAGLLFGIIGEEKLSKRAFIGWPIAAAYTISAISKIAH